MPAITQTHFKIDQALLEIGHLMRRYYRREFKALGITVAASRALFHIAKNEGTAQRTLADLLEIQPITLVRTLDGLQRDGLIERRHSSTDRRVWLLHVTPEGQDVLEKMHAINEKKLKIIMADLDKTQVRIVAEQLLVIQTRLADLLTVPID